MEDTPLVIVARKSTRKHPPTALHLTTWPRRQPSCVYYPVYGRGYLSFSNWFRAGDYYFYRSEGVGRSAEASFLFPVVCG